MQNISTENKLTIDDEQILIKIVGINDKNIRRMERISGCSIRCEGNEICYEGEDSFIIEKTLSALKEIAAQGGSIYGNLIEIIYRNVAKNLNIDISNIMTSNIEIPKMKKIINPRSITQGLYIQQLQEKDIVFAYGPAGTGKTYIAIAYALSELLNKRYNKIILTRPVVEAGESLGFLPGDFSQKINPYLIPLFDAINSLISQEINVKLTNQNLIEIAPLAYMRGRTFSDAIVILDEAQNTTNTQMKMFLTRLGDHGKLIISGDISQTDLPRKVPSGMATALQIFAKENIDEIGIVEFCDEDVVRHPVVRKIINAYTKYEKQENDNGKEKN